MKKVEFKALNYTRLQKVEYLLKKSTDLNENLNLSSGNRQRLPKKIL